MSRTSIVPSLLIRMRLKRSYHVFKRTLSYSSTEPSGLSTTLDDVSIRGEGYQELRPLGVLEEPRSA